jgi:hypothetical protein
MRLIIKYFILLKPMGTRHKLFNFEYNLKHFLVSCFYHYILYHIFIVKFFKLMYVYVTGKSRNWANLRNARAKRELPIILEKNVIFQFLTGQT